MHKDDNEEIKTVSVGQMTVSPMEEAFTDKVILPKEIFNQEKVYDANNPSAFDAYEPGLIDTINRRHPKIWELYKRLRAQDWDEMEFGYAKCLSEFKTCEPPFYKKMTLTLAWQYEQDSSAANNLVSILAPFNPSTEFWGAILRIAENEFLHGLTYSEIFKLSFENPNEVIQEVLGQTAAYRRLHAVALVFKETKDVAAKIFSGELDPNSKEARRARIRFCATMFAMERIQFMASFAITFAFGSIGMFMPIAKAVQKIAVDELYIHVQTYRQVLLAEARVLENKEIFVELRKDLKRIVDEIVTTEIEWNKNVIFADGIAVGDANLLSTNDWIYMSAAPVYETLGLTNPWPKITRHPLPYMNDWLDLNRNQNSPQEEKGANYLLGGFIDDLSSGVYVPSFIKKLGADNDYLKKLTA